MPVDKFDLEHYIVELALTTQSGSYYNRWRPWPVLELASDPKVNSNRGDCPYAFEWNVQSVEDFNNVLSEIHKQIDAYDAGTLPIKNDKF